MPTSVELAAAASPRAPSYFGVSAEFGRANMQARCARGTQEARPLNFVGAEIDRHAAANVSPALVFEPVLQVFRLRGKRLSRTGFFIRRFASASGRSDRASRGVEAKPPVANDALCHEVEKLARAAPFPAPAIFAPVRSRQNSPGRRRDPTPPAGGRGARHDRGLCVTQGVGTFVRMVYCWRRKEKACGRSL